MLRLFWRAVCFVWRCFTFYILLIALLFVDYVAESPSRDAVALRRNLREVGDTFYDDGTHVPWSLAQALLLFAPLVLALPCLGLGLQIAREDAEPLPRKRSRRARAEARRAAARHPLHTRALNVGFPLFFGVTAPMSPWLTFRLLAATCLVPFCYGRIAYRWLMLGHIAPKTIFAITLLVLLRVVWVIIYARGHRL